MAKQTKKSSFNMYYFSNKHRKKIVSVISIIIVFSMLLGLLSGFAMH